MVIVSDGTEGTIAVALPETFRASAEKICDVLRLSYPRATVRVVVNHCLAPEIVRADRVDSSVARSIVEALRKQAPAALPPTTLHEQIAACLGWAVEETQPYSLRALRDLVQAHDPKLALLIGREIAPTPTHLGYCCFCSQEVLRADYVAFAHVPGSERAAHRTCLTASGKENLLDIHAMIKALFVVAPNATIRAYCDTLDDTSLRLACRAVLRP